MRSVLLSSIFALAATALVACSAPMPTACTPGCREGFTCVAGACVSSCNPACASGETCDSSGGRARCVANDGGASDGAVHDSSADSAIEDSAIEDSTIADTGSATDSASDASASDASTSDASGMDASTSDASGADSATLDSNSPDGATDASPDARPACGMPGQSCCGRYCVYGSTCETPAGAATGTCVAFTPVANECVGTTPCAMAGQRCGVGYQCGERRCNLCQPNSGAQALDTACTGSAQCQSGFCFGGKCASLCAVGASGDSACAAMIPGGICSGGSSSLAVMPEGGAARSSVLSFGACRRGCARNGDCPTAGDICAPANNEGADRVDFVCRAAGAGLAGGSVCTSGSQCSSGSCISTGGTGVCFQPCTAATDCPAIAPMCGDIFWIRPSGGSQAGRACVAR